MITGEAQLEVFRYNASNNSPVGPCGDSSDRIERMPQKPKFIKMYCQKQQI